MSLAPPPNSNLNFMPYDAYAHHGRQLMQAHNDKLKEMLGIPITLAPVRLHPVRDVEADYHQNGVLDPVGILGAGAGGLYTAMLLEGLGIPYHILEARNRVGGRLFTFQFPNSTGAPYNYFDVGAMRFPNVTAMKRVFDLFEDPLLNTPDLALKKRLRPYYYSGTGPSSNFFFYNGVVARKNLVPSGDPFKAHEVIMDTDGSPYIAVGPDAIMDDALEPFMGAIYNDIETGGNEGWKFMMKYDHHSVRSYILSEYVPSDGLALPKTHLSIDVVNWVESFVDPRDRFDLGLTDFVLDAISFGWHPNATATNWYLIDGGSEQLAKTMYKYLSSKRPGNVSFNSRVTSMAFNSKAGHMDVVTHGKHRRHHRFSHVISTLPLPAMRMIELKDAGLSPIQRNALRQLNYAPSVKIGMQFKTAWWTTSNDLDHKRINIIGGQSSTDTPLQAVVYPSYGDALHGNTPTLIASYSAMEEAVRMSAWIKNNTEDAVIVEPSNDPLVVLVVRELAKVHNIAEEFLREQLIATKPWSWTQDPYTMGAFGLFGPGGFQNLYTSLNTPAANGHLHFAGEAISTRHAWVAGAFDSAWRAVREMLLFPPFKRYEKTFFEMYGVNQEWVRAPNRTTAVRIPEAPVDLVWEHVALTHPELL